MIAEKHFAGYSMIAQMVTLISAEIGRFTALPRLLSSYEMYHTYTKTSHLDAITTNATLGIYCMYHRYVHPYATTHVQRGVPCNCGFVCTAILLATEQIG